MNVGDYVRTQYGYIRKVKSVTKFPDGDIHIYCGVSLYYRPREITKHSNNIIDLIEVGDYVNGEEVISVGKKWLDTTNNTLRYDNIKSIVTHQQFEEMEYKVNE